MDASRDLQYQIYQDAVVTAQALEESSLWVYSPTEKAENLGKGLFETKLFQEVNISGAFK